MLKIINLSTMLFFCTVLFTCSNLYATESSPTSEVEWDFDHHLQFKQIQFTKHSYQLEVIPNKKVSFERLAAFLLRKSYSLCQNYQYQLKVIQGVEEFDEHNIMANYIPRRLVAHINCPN